MNPSNIHSLNLSVAVSDGARLEQVIVDLCTLADRLGLTVRTEFNGHSISASPGDTAEHVRACWDRGRANDAKYALSPAGVTSLSKPLTGVRCYMVADVDDPAPAVPHPR